ncbi:hypothetical protein GCM10010270_35220 [Streptomyces violaceus]|nr:hypothetical protein GCM10010270_35220 [Streptomyces janthinus]
MPVLHVLRRGRCTSPLRELALTAEGPASEREVVGKYPQRPAAAQRAYGTEVSSVEGENRVRVAVGGKRHVHRVGEVEVQRAVSDTDGLGGAQVVFRDLRRFS